MVGSFFSVKAFLFREQWHTIRRYYRKPRFAFADLMLGCFSFFFNPYRVCRRFLQQKKEAMIYAYGETPLREFEKLANAAKISASDTFVEMGCGRGKLCFWVAEFVGCRTLGVEWVPLFVCCGTWIARIFGMDVWFEQKSMLDFDLSRATAVYLYALHLSDEQMRELAKRCKSMPKGAVVISISEPLPVELFTVEQVLSIQFPWGQADAYIQRRL